MPSVGTCCFKIRDLSKIPSTALPHNGLRFVLTVFKRVAILLSSSVFQESISHAILHFRSLIPLVKADLEARFKET